MLQALVARPAPIARLRRLPSVLILACALAGPARAHDALGIATSCWEDVRLFESLAAGTVDYCRRKLRYVPGTLDCYRVIDHVCVVFVPLTGAWIDTRRPRLRVPVRCPSGPTPPVCRRLDLR